ncbi:DNA-binding protein [Enterococcus italicus]|uniref:DNA-binding protein n=1 Tax=Enterococcus italicus TaxID=246144 RepID=UPI003F47B4DD
MTMEETLANWRQEEFQKALSMMEQALSVLSEQNDIVKQKDCALFFNVSVNLLKDWVKQGAPEIRLENGSPFYSKKAITEWLLRHQK